ncbi:GTP-binding protein [Streptomyces sp. I05A-00742]|uniref:GTP-binding protein n=1 Tax=Streptomyces sp. I05A-00742 TaxID=2732853 RepID=UPI0014895F77|nr:GTP-binding protein [Streptomyces sp. I05A-00742]
MAGDPVRPRQRKHRTIGAIGNRGHGKTTLAVAVGKAAAKTYRQDAGAVERIVEAAGRTRAAVAVHSTHSAYATPGCHYTHFDISAGHVGDLLGHTPLDGVVLVVSALGDVTPQAREHLRLARGAGVRGLVVFLNKCDVLQDPEAVDEAERRVRALLREPGPDGDPIPIVRGSALQALAGDAFWEASVVELMKTLDARVRA